MAKILIVDDDVDIVKVLSKQLEHAGFNVIAVYDGLFGVEMAHKERPDLIILDMMLPAGGGDGVLKNLKSSQHTNRIPVIILTGMDNDKRRKAVEDMGVEAYVKKPYEIEQFIALINDKLKK